MKVRKQFVSNSSSTSYIITWRGDLRNIINRYIKNFPNNDPKKIISFLNNNGNTQSVDSYLSEIKKDMLNSNQFILENYNNQHYHYKLDWDFDRLITLFESYKKFKEFKLRGFYNVISMSCSDSSSDKIELSLDMNPIDLNTSDLYIESENQH